MQFLVTTKHLLCQTFQNCRRDLRSAEVKYNNNTHVPTVASRSENRRRFSTPCVFSIISFKTLSHLHQPFNHRKHNTAKNCRSIYSLPTVAVKSMNLSLNKAIDVVHKRPLCRDCCLCLALRTPRGACQK